jgi:hypothetical protein
MTVSRQLSQLGASGSALAANSAPVCARGVRHNEREGCKWRIFGHTAQHRGISVKMLLRGNQWLSDTERALGREKSGVDQCCLR